MADLQQFINNNTGKYIASRGGITGQCVSLAQAWAEANGVGGTPVFPVAAAKDMAGSRSDAFTWVANTPSAVPQAGDIMVWGSGLGPYGHTAVFVSGDVNSFVSFDQNYPIGSSAHKQAHNYNAVTGWLRLKNNNQGGGGMGVPNTEYDRVVVDNYNLGVQLRNTQGKLAEVTQIANTREEQIRSMTHVATGRSGYDPVAVLNKLEELNANVAQYSNSQKQQIDRINELSLAVETANELTRKLNDELVKAGADKASLTKKVEALQKQVDGLGTSTPTTLDSFSVGELISAVIKKLFNKGVKK